MKKLTEEWLKAAEDDLRVIERLLPPGMPSLAYAEKFHAFARAVHENIKSALEVKQQGD